LNIEDERELVAYLRQAGHVTGPAAPAVQVLAGGVSNRTVLVRFDNGMAWVLKQALPKLRVAQDWYCDPRRIEREALALDWLAKLLPAGAVPTLQMVDAAHHLLAMTAVPNPHENWKSRLLAGQVEPALVRTFGTRLGQLHQRSAEPATAVTLSKIFDDQTYFEALRLHPYYEAAAERNPRARDFFKSLIDETRTVRTALVHGDYSPKNILVHQGELVLLDFEVIHFGDPAFDLGFSMTHFLSKAHHCPAAREPFRQAARDHWDSYLAARGETISRERPTLESRAVRHTLACLLARVDGRSPLEYLSAAERDGQRRFALDLIDRRPASLAELIEAFTSRLAN
jgi:aminoglycoside phosphotransferase (APT) family kinase protein